MVRALTCPTIRVFVINAKTHTLTIHPPRIILLVVLSLSLMWLDSHQTWLQSVRYQLGFILAPTQSLSLIPSAMYNWFEESGANQQQLLIENKQLTARNLVLELKLQQLTALETENKNLRELLSASEQIDDRVLVTSVIAIDPDPFSQQVLINKGGEDGVFIGQPVLDAFGLLGQVIDVMPYSALVMMIADPNHAIPVQVNRNGVRSIAVGTGSLTQLELTHVPTTADIVAGDLLVSSGLGERYPKGYPVATVTSVENIPGQPFAVVKADTSAQLDRSRYLLLVFSQGAGRVPSKDLWRQEK